MGAAAGPHVMLAVSDTGIGMDDETKARIFEPFFTTKDVGEGTGLGLASVYGTVKQSGGSIWVYSEPGEGTTIHVYLPRTLEQTVPSGEHERVGIARGDETVLVAEDEEAVRQLIVRTLGSAGYRVLEARDGSDALRRVAELDGRVDLLVTDVVMPTMGGRELAERLASEHLGIRVLFISGYTGNSLAHGGKLEEGVAFLEKPFSPAALAAKVRAVLDGEE
jgi:two-component system cell cycle sensor histidine kinase/response regulator CckA